MEAFLLFILVVAINSVAVYLQRRFKTYSRLFGRYDWAVHIIVLSIIWGLFISGLILIRPPIWKLSATLHPLSVLAILIGFYMVVATWARLGTKGTLNGWFFGRGAKESLKGGVFRLQNPMYTGFAFLFIGAAFWLENGFYLWMAALSFILLNVIQARIEMPTS